jgi:hypothetical protein
VQLLEVGQCMDIVVLLKVGESQIELNFAQLRANAEHSLIGFDRLAIAVGLGIQHAQICERAHVARIELQNFVETGLGRGIVSCVERLHRRLKRLPRGIRRKEQSEGESGRKKFHEHISL